MNTKTSKIIKNLIPYIIIAIIGGIVSTSIDFIELHPILVGILTGGVFYGIVYYKKKNAKKYRKNIEHGSASWGTEKDIEPFIDKNPLNNIPLTKTESITMNNRPNPIKNARNKNVMVIGGSGTGKTRFYLLPQLLQCQSTDYPVSFVITDPKGGIIGDTGKILAKNGYNIKILNMLDFKSSMRYNPLAYVKDEKDILSFTTALISNTTPEGQKASDPFWEKTEIILYQSLIGYIIYETPSEDHNMESLVKMLNHMEVREEDETFKNAIDILFEELEEENKDHFAVLQYKKYKMAAGKTAKSILISCAARLSPFDINEVKEITKTDELDLHKLGEEKTALFVIVDDTDPTYNFIPGIMYTQLFSILCKRADLKHNGRLPIHVRFLLDEFSNIGKIPRFEQLVTTIRSREISVSVILQTQSQLKALYKDNMETIIGNMDIVLFLGGKEPSSLEGISKMLGKETIDTFNTGNTKGSQESHNLNYQKLGRELMTVDEIGLMDNDLCILNIRGVKPFKSVKYNPADHPNFKHVPKDDKNKYNVKSRLNTKLNLKQEARLGETYTMYEYNPPEAFNYNNVAS